jgi:outer membrane protein assembly factor BamD
MFKNRLIIGVTILLTVVLISGCGEYEKLLKSRDFAKKYETAVKLYEEGDYAKSGTLFDQVANIYRGTTKADTVKYYQAKSYFGQRDYLMAGHYFSELSSTYISSVYKEEADFMIGYCFYKQSPRPELDQTATFQTINGMQMFMVKYPNSERLTECQEIIMEMADKLVEKSYISAKLYFDLGYYKSAIIALRNSLIEFPETKFREELMFMILKSSFLLADKSVPGKQRERFQAAVDEYYSFIGEFPEGHHSKEAIKIYENSSNYLEEKNNKSS